MSVLRVLDWSRTAVVLPVVLVVASCSGGDARPDGSSASHEDDDACPADMVVIPSLNVCIDRYEASQGEGGKAESVFGVMPWANVSWYSARDACIAAEKRLCDESEWFDACSGPAPGTVYPYGDTYDPQACNGDEHGVNAAVPTGSMTTCEGGYPGVFDMSGNLWEWTSTCGRVRGGAFFNRELVIDYLRCRYRADRVPVDDVDGDTIGFRCCVSR
ncbi:MAG: SUMF1/EgtB/PvdO family nonheme iron enzyme [Pseudomonadota bacterium]